MPPLPSRLPHIVFALALGCGIVGLAPPSRAEATATPQKTIVLDPGHTPALPGALGVRGINELVYNDTLTAQIAGALRASGFRVVLTRAPEQNIGLVQRALIANSLHADLFLAIHHDSAQPQYLDKITDGNRIAYRSKRPLSGYSIFVSGLNPQYADSLRFALGLGQRLLQLGRAPSHHHAENIPGENRPCLNPALGVYRYDNLAVLKRTAMPAALLEVGVIVDPDDERYVSNTDNQTRIAQAITTAIRQFFTPVTERNKADKLQ